MFSSKLSMMETGSGFQVAREASIPIWDLIYRIELESADDLTKFVTDNNIASCVYNPLLYAKEVHLKYLQRFINSRKDVLYLGLNPGPDGMCQTGVSRNLFSKDSFLYLIPNNH